MAYNWIAPLWCFSDPHDPMKNLEPPLHIIPIRFWCTGQSLTATASLHPPIITKNLLTAFHDEWKSNLVNRLTIPITNGGRKQTEGFWHLRLITYWNRIWQVYSSFKTRSKWCTLLSAIIQANNSWHDTSCCSWWHWKLIITSKQHFSGHLI